MRPLLPRSSSANWVCPRSGCTLWLCEVGRDLVGNSTGGSRTLYGLGSAILDLCRRLMEHGSAQVAALWGCTQEQVLIDGGIWRHASGVGPSLRFEDWLDQNAQALQGLELIGEASSGATFPNGCHIAEVEIDPQTRLIGVGRLLGCRRCGRSDLAQAAARPGPWRRGTGPGPSLCRARRL